MAIKVTDPVYNGSDKFDLIETLCLKVIKDRRDVPFLILISKVLIFVVPFAVCLFLVKELNVWICLGYLGTVMIYFLGPVTLMLHNTSHRPLFRRSHVWLNSIIPWFICLFFGQSPETYYVHHIGMHHVEENFVDDLSTTIFFQRDSVWCFFQYIIDFFVFIFFVFFQPLYGSELSRLIAMGPKQSRLAQDPREAPLIKVSQDDLINESDLRVEGVDIPTMLQKPDWLNSVRPSSLCQYPHRSSHESPPGLTAKTTMIEVKERNPIDFDPEQIETRSKQGQVINVKYCKDNRITTGSLIKKLKEWRQQERESYQAIADDLIDELKKEVPQDRISVPPIPESFFSICDSNGKIYSIGKIDPTHSNHEKLYLDRLIGSPVPTEKGGGTAAIEYLKYLARAQGIKRIELEPIDDAIVFYEKMGFREGRAVKRFGQRVRLMDLTLEP